MQQLTTLRSDLDDLQKKLVEAENDYERIQELKISAEEMIIQQLHRISELESHAEKQTQLESELERLSVDHMRQVSSFTTEIENLKVELVLTIENLRLALEQNESSGRMIVKLEDQMKESLRESIDFKYEIVKLHEDIARIQQFYSAKEGELLE